MEQGVHAEPVEWRTSPLSGEWNPPMSPNPKRPVNSPRKWVRRATGSRIWPRDAMTHSPC